MKHILEERGMITVSIFINGNPVITRSARRTRMNKRGVGTYKLDTGKTLTHNYEEGAIVLAKRMLDTVVEP